MPDTDDVQAMFGRRLTEYQKIWEDATARMMTGTYRSEDFIDDWFAWWGRAARDMTAAATLAFGQFSQPPAPGGSPSRDVEERFVADERGT